jgi:hypothetical protein
VFLIVMDFSSTLDGFGKLFNRRNDDSDNHCSTQDLAAMARQYGKILPHGKRRIGRLLSHSEIPLLLFVLFMTGQLFITAPPRFILTSRHAAHPDPSGIDTRTMGVGFSAQKVAGLKFEAG